MKIITRSVAKELGLKKYFSGKPCPKGHISNRNTINSSCVDCLSNKAKLDWENGKRRSKESCKMANKNWNASKKGITSKQKWKEKDPKNAWAVSARGGCKVRSEKKGSPFNVSSAYILSITPDECPVFKTKFIFIGQKTCPESATIDRLDPKKGYVEGNIAVISMRANTIKNAYGSEEIFKVAEWLKGQDY